MTVVRLIAIEGENNWREYFGCGKLSWLREEDPGPVAHGVSHGQGVPFCQPVPRYACRHALRKARDSSCQSALTTALRDSSISFSSLCPLLSMLRPCPFPSDPLSRVLRGWHSVTSQVPFFDCKDGSMVRGKIQGLLCGSFDFCGLLIWADNCGDGRNARETTASHVN